MTQTKSSVRKLVPGIRTLKRKVCPPGMIERREFTRRYSTAVMQRGFEKKTKS
jgi:ribosomal protein S30